MSSFSMLKTSWPPLVDQSLNGQAVQGDTFANFQKRFGGLHGFGAIKAMIGWHKPCGSFAMTGNGDLFASGDLVKQSTQLVFGFIQGNFEHENLLCKKS
jgi:hypothetical protein